MEAFIFISEDVCSSGLTTLLPAIAMDGAFPLLFMLVSPFSEGSGASTLTSSVFGFSGSLSNCFEFSLDGLEMG